MFKYNIVVISNNKGQKGQHLPDTYNTSIHTIL